VSLPTISGTGRLITDPKRGVTSANNPWCNCVVRLVGYKKTDTGAWEEDTSYAATIAAFGDVARQLATFAKGDEIQFTGKLKDLSVWTPARGEPRAQLSIKADELTRPEKRKRSDGAGVSGGATQNRSEQAFSWHREDQRDLRQGAGADSRRSRQESADDRGPARGVRDQRSDQASRRRETVGQSTTHDRQPDPGRPVDLDAYRNGANAKLLRAHANNPRTTGRPA
jgi:hypothetical protein